MSRFVFRVSRFVFRMSRFAFRVSRFVFRASRFVFRMNRFAFRMNRFVFRMNRFVFRVSRLTFLQMQRAFDTRTCAKCPKLFCFYTNSIIKSSCSTNVFSERCTFNTLPAIGEAIVDSIFMASMVKSGVPA